MKIPNLYNKAQNERNLNNQRGEIMKYPLLNDRLRGMNAKQLKDIKKNCCYAGEAFPPEFMDEVWKFIEELADGNNIVNYISANPMYSIDNAGEIITLKIINRHQFENFIACIAYRKLAAILLNAEIK